MTTESVIQAFGPVAGIVIIALAAVVVFLYRGRESDRKEAVKQYNDLQEKRYAEALETQDKLVGLVNEQKELPERIYNLALSRKGKRN